MKSRRMLWLWTVLLCPLAGWSAEEKPPKEVMGILGGSTTFSLESPRPFVKVFWLKNDIQVVNLRRGPPCQVHLLNAFVSRDMTVSQNCRSLTIRGLHEEDSARYTALILDSKEIIARQTFILKVYRYSAKEKLPKEVMGILGESATFLLESPRSFTLIYWFRNETGMATLRPEPPPCQFTLVEAYRSRDVTVSQDCRSLTVRGLRKEDSAGYEALMLNSEEIVANQTFNLKVDRNTGEASGLSSEVTIGVTIAILMVAKVIITAAVCAKWLSCTK